ncbi:MAG: oxygenase MpaB family protein [Candidatus Dormibacteria bacterium]
MGARFLSPQEFMQLLAVPVPFADRLTPLPIADTAADPGLFGPGSVTWRVLREPMLILAGARALLLQAAHPHVAQGAIDHSAYADDPFGRLMRTYTWAGTVAFGTTAEARAASAGVNRLHRGVTGSLPRGHATRRVRSGSGYSAMDPDLLLWVHATFVDTLLVSHDRMVGGLTEADRDQFVREWEVVARLMGVPQRLLWPDHATLRRYVERQLGRGAAHPGEGSRLVAETVLHPPLPSPVLRPLMDALAFMSVGFLPPGLRKAYGIPWTIAHAAAHRSITITLRTTRAGLPRRLRVAPIYDFALARSRGELRPAARRRLPRPRAA